MKPPEGVGIGLRTAFARDLVRRSDRAPDWIEVVPEAFVDAGGWRKRLIDACAERWTVVPHAVSLSLGGPDPLDPATLAAMVRFCRAVGAPYFSDHISYAILGGTHLHNLLPLPFSEEAVAHVVGRIRQAQARLEVPLVLENPTLYARMPGCTMDEASFLLAVLEESGCEMLLDVNNVYVNARNHGYDPYAFVDRMPLARVRQLHVAGHRRHATRDLLLDTHEGPIIDEVWDLFRYTLKRAGRFIPTLLEWDQKIPPLDVLLDEADRARAYGRAALGLEAAA